MIDRIEYHVQHAQEYIDTAKQDTKKAREFQRKSRRVGIIVSFDMIYFIYDLLIIFLFGFFYRNK